MCVCVCERERERERECCNYISTIHCTSETDVAYVSFGERVKTGSGQVREKRHYEPCH